MFCHRQSSSIGAFLLKICNWLDSFYKFSSNNPSRHPISGFSRTTEALPKLIKHGVVCYLFINPLFDVSQHAVRVVVEIIEGPASEQHCAFLQCHHHQTHLAM